MSNKEYERKSNELMVNAIIKALKRADIPVIKAADDLAEILQMAGLPLAYKKKEAPETVSVSDKKHRQTVISSADGAKILKNLDKLILSYQKDVFTKEKTFLGYVAKAIEAKTNGSKSEYATFITPNNIVLTVRLSNHNATVETFDYKGESEGISIVLSSKDNEGIKNNGNAHIIEFYYDSIKLRKAYGQPLVEILQSLKEALLTGEYKDTTGLAQREEVNARFLKDKSGIIYGWTSNGKIYLTKDGLNPKTMIHEYTHLWSNAMMYGNPEGWQSVKDIMRQDPLWRDVKGDTNYADIADDEDMVVSEVLARRSEQNNSVLLERQAERVLREDSQNKDYQEIQLLFKMKEALNTFWDWVTTKLFNMKRFQSMEQVSNRVLYDLVNSTPLQQPANTDNKIEFSIGPVKTNDITDVSVIKRGFGYGIRYKANGIQQDTISMSFSEKVIYEKLLRVGNQDKTQEYIHKMAEKYFESQVAEQSQNKSFKR